MMEAMKSMAASAIGVDLHDHVLQDLLGGDTTLAYDGRDALDQTRHEYGFPVKTYRETIIIPPVDDTLWPWVALALRRDSGSLEDAKEQSEYIEADHLNMCRFASAGNDGYRSIASFILRLAHHQLLRVGLPRLSLHGGMLTTRLLQKHRSTPEEEASLQLLAAPGSTNQPPQSTTPAIVFSDMPTRKAPPWLLKHPAFRSWYHRKSPADRDKLLWLRGPAACGKSELLSSLISHISTEWSPTTHSSATITVIVEGESLLESTIQKSDGAQNHNYDHRNTNQRQQYTTTTPTTPTDHTGKSSDGSRAPTGGPTHETASPLRTILQQLWAHDPRLRNLVGGLAKASSLRAREADSCDRPDRTQSDAGAREPQPQQPKVYSRRPNSGPGGSGGGGGTNNKGAQGQRRQGQLAAGKEGGRAIRKRSDGGGDGDNADTAADDNNDDHHHHHLDDARLVSFFLEDYLRLELRQTRAQAKEEGSRAAAGVKAKSEDEKEKEKENQKGDKVSPLPRGDTTKPAVVVETPGTRRIFIFVDVAPTTAPATARDLVWCLAQLARRSTISICVASRDLDLGGGGPGMAIKHTDAFGDVWRIPRKPVGEQSVQQQQDDDDDDEGSSTMLTVDVATSNAEDVSSYIEAVLLPDIEDRAVLAAKLAERSRGVMFWLEHAVAIVNDASEDGVSGEIVCSMLDDIAPEVSPPAVAAAGAGAGLAPPVSRSRSGSSSSVMAAARAQDPGQARLDDLYAWKLRRLSVGEARAALVLMQWVMLAPEALRLNELLVAIRLTMLVWPQNLGNTEEQGVDLGARALDIEPPMSLRDLRRRPAGGAEYVPADNPSQFWRWARRISQGLVKLEGEGRTTTNSSNSKVSSEPLGLQRVVPAHESVRRFFLEGRGFQILTPSPSSQSLSTSKTKQQQPPPPPPPTVEQLIDTSYYALLHTCLVYLNMTDFDSLSRTSTTTTHSNTASAHIRTPSEPPSEAEEESTRLHRSNAEAQRALVTSSYPLLRYTVDNLLFHLLRPRALRYFPPQARLLRLLTSDGCRIWRRWTRLLGIPDSSSSGGADVPAAVLDRARARPSAAVLLRPVYGASFRLERVLRRACKTAKEQAALAARARARSRLRSQRSARSVKSAGGGGEKAPPTPRTPTRPPMVRSASEQSVVFALVGGGDDAPKAQWLVPKSPRSPRLRSDSLGSIGSSPMSNPASPGVLLGIQEV